MRSKASLLPESPGLSLLNGGHSSVDMSTSTIGFIRDLRLVLRKVLLPSKPIQVSAKMPRRSSAFTNEWGIALTLYYGSSPWNFADYWNLSP